MNLYEVERLKTSLISDYFLQYAVQCVFYCVFLIIHSMFRIIWFNFVYDYSPEYFFVDIGKYKLKTNINTKSVSILAFTFYYH